MTDLDRDIAELEAALRHLKKLRKADRISKANTGKKRSAAVRQRMSEASKAACADPAVRQRMSEARKAACADPAVRQRMSEARKAAWAEKHERDLAPKQKRESRKGMPQVPRDPFEAALFGGARR